MATIFISHATADKPLVEPFVSTVIQLGCKASPDDIFYSSGADTGVPSGETLNSYVRDRVAEAGIVVAIITPMFLSRPFCIAELGAAWSRSGNLFPLLMPSLKREDLDGVLDGLATRYINEIDALNELHDRVVKAIGADVRAATWQRHVGTWIANVDTYSAAIPPIRKVSIDDLERAESAAESVKKSLRQANETIAELEEQNERLAVAASAAEAYEIRLPKDEEEQFNARLDAVLKALTKVPAVVVDVLWAEIYGRGGVALPSHYDNPDGRADLLEAEEKGYLVSDDGFFTASTRGVSRVEEIRRRIEELGRFLEGDLGGPRSERFVEWFDDKYGWPPDLRARELWETLVR